MKYIQPPWENYFFSKVHAAEKSLFISSPYIKFPVASLLCEILQSKQNSNLSVQLLTRIRISDLIDGASDLEAFEKLLQLAEIFGLDVVVKCMSNLHAKVYIFDGNSAIVTSSNLTPSGLKSNVEYGIEVTEQIAIRQILDDMSVYWRAAETLTAVMIEQVGKRLKTTESVVTVDEGLIQRRKHQLTKEPAISMPQIGKSFAPQVQDIQFAELDNLRGRISATSKYPKKSKVVITHPEVPIDVEDEPDIDGDLTGQETEIRIIEVECSYGELEEDSVEQLISELKTDDKQRKETARARLEALFVLDNSCIIPHITELASADLHLCCNFLGRSQDSGFAITQFLHILNTAKTQRGTLPNLVLMTLNYIAPEILFSFLCSAMKEPLSTGAKLNAIEWLKNAAVQLNLNEKDSAIEILKSLTENTHSKVCKAAYVALGEVGEVKSKDYLRNAFNQAQRRKMPPHTQVSILRGLIVGGVTPDDELMFVRLSYSHLAEFRAVSVRALRQRGKKYWQRLSDMAESDPSAVVIIEAARALVAIDTATAMKVLIKLRENNPEDRVKTEISWLIRPYEEYIRDLSATEKQTLQSAISDLQSSYPKARQKAAKILGQLKHDSAVQSLHHALEDKDEIVRKVAARELGKLGDNRSALPFIAMLENDSCSHARAAAAKALGQCAAAGDERALDVLLHGRNDKSAAVRNWCSRSVKQLRG